MVVAVVDDLLFSSKIRSIAEHLGEPIAFVRARDAVVPALTERGARAVIFDLDRAPLDPVGAIREIRSRSDLAHVRVLAFVRHTSAETIAEARRAGADVVLARSAFFPALPDLLSDRAAAPNAT
jgi:DNA-binding NarL/FixJ family response regulator